MLPCLDFRQRGMGDMLLATGSLLEVETEPNPYFDQIPGF